MKDPELGDKISFPSKVFENSTYEKAPSLTTQDRAQCCVTDARSTVRLVWRGFSDATGL